MGLLNYDKLFQVEKKNNVETLIIFYLSYYLAQEIFTESEN